MKTHKTAVIVAAIVTLGVGIAAAQSVQDRVPLTYKVEHEHRRGLCSGELTIDKWQFAFTSADKPEDSRTWKLTDLKEVESKVPTELVLKTRNEAAAKGMGLDRNYKFKVLGSGIEREVVEYMKDRVQ